MPGSSLWLLPPAGHPINAILTNLIKKTSDHFNSPHLFIPHITLTSNISPSKYSNSGPQKWLDNLDLPSHVLVRMKSFASDEPFFRKLYCVISKNKSIVALARAARRTVEGYEDEAEAWRWALEEYIAHLSFLYHDIPVISQEEIDKIRTMAEEALADYADEKGAIGRWEGGRVVLVPTDRPIDEWEPIAERTLLGRVENDEEEEVSNGV